VITIFKNKSDIPQNMEYVNVQTLSGEKVIDDYEELKEWWDNEE
jgi:hypothetical protein